MDRLLFVCLGGALGSGARYLVGLFVEGQKRGGFETHHPIGTWTCNVLGSFLLGLLAAYCATRGVPETVKLGLTTGLMGGFTTYSTFSLETFRFMQRGQWSAAIINVVFTLVVCLIASALGFYLGGGTRAEG